MSFNSIVTGATTSKLLMARAAANTTAATGLGIDITEYEGYVIVTQNVGVVTAGTIVGKLQTCTAADGTGADDIPGAAFASVGTATDEACASIVLKVDGLKQFIRYVGTITTGPADVGVSMVGIKKYI